jgi:predicted ATP-grasp superfamily ATP-dependent carboligase
VARLNDSHPPAILLGGICNAVSVARSLGRAGVRVYALNVPDAPVFHSRYCIPLRLAGPDLAAWGSYLLGPASEQLRGAVLLACSDMEVEYIAHNREALAARYRLDLSNPAAQLCVLNKLDTYHKAAAAGVPIPQYWAPRTRPEVEAIRDQLSYPLVVKPLVSHAYRQRFPIKLVVAHDFDQVIKATDSARMAGLEVMIVEMVPGLDDRLCSYYTYLDEAGTPLFDFTKRIIRRSPPLYGNGSCHVTDWNPEVKELALRFFQAIGLRGLANAEFKRDERDGQLKFIECNARFTEANCLVLDSGLDLPRLVYGRLTGQPLPPLTNYHKGLRLWYPIDDFHAFRQLRREGKMTWRGWLASIGRPRVFPFFRWSDPLPSVVREVRRLTAGLRRRVSSLARVLTGR